MRTMTTNFDSLLDERCMRLWRSPSGLTHVEGWFNETICHKYIDSGNWQWWMLTSLRHVARMSQSNSRDMCKVCAREYKDVIVDGPVSV